MLHTWVPLVLLAFTASYFRVDGQTSEEHALSNHDSKMVSPITGDFSNVPLSYRLA